MARYLPDKTATIFISCGELSGEMHAAHLIRALQSLRAERGLPAAIFEGNGSQRMHEAGAEIFLDIATWSELGIIHNMMKAQFFHRAVMATARYILSNQPDMVVLVDNRVLNLSLAKLLRNRGYTGRIVYYVAPVRWQSLYDPQEHKRSLRNSRFRDIKRYCDLALLIYPVSLAVYDELGIPYEYTGHPLCEIAKPVLSDAEFAGLAGIEAQSEQQPIIIGALPGSRVREVACIAPVMYRALALMQDALLEEPDLPPLHVISPVPHAELREGIIKAARQARLKNLTLIDPKYNYDLMARARLMLVKSGTGLHECMLMGVPVIGCYRIEAYLAWIARYIMRFHMPYFGFPNLLAGRAIMPEMIQEDCTYLKIADMASGLLFDETERADMQQAFKELREMVCRPEPLKRAATKVQELLTH